MKAVRFIAIFSFLLVFNLLSVSFVNSQETKDQKTTETKPDATAAVQPVLIGKPNEDRYRIGLYDVLDIAVSKHADLSQGYVKLDERGRIRMPRIDYPISAICKTENELAAEIMDVYRKTLLRDPYVTVVVKEQNSHPISVIGAVKKPGSFFTNRKLTLLDIIAYAGGPDVEFAGNKVQVARVGDISGCSKDNNAVNSEEGITFFSYNLPDILKGKTNPLMRPGDIVSVLDADVVYVYGNVNKEGPVKIKEQITLMQAIVSAEGLKPSSKSKVRILRQKEGSTDRDELIFDYKDINQRKIPDPLLMPNDVVAISEDPAKSIMRGILKTVTTGIGGLFYRVP